MRRLKERRGEVVMVIDRPGNTVLLHRKSWYEPGIYRLPTGGIERGESIELTLERELKEETGLRIIDGQLLGILVCDIAFERKRLQFPSVIFRLVELEGELQLPDSPEDISDFRDLPIDDLPRTAARLRKIPAPRTGWGRWRAAAHDWTHELLQAA